MFAFQNLKGSSAVWCGSDEEYPTHDIVDVSEQYLGKLTGIVMIANL